VSIYDRERTGDINGQREGEKKIEEESDSSPLF